MRRMSIVLMTLILVFGLAISSHAILIDRGGGMIYSTDLDVTWLQDAKYARTSNYDSDGFMPWNQAMSWAANLEYGGYDDWRLPTYDPDGNHQRDDATTEHEMAYLIYTELGNNDGDWPMNYGPFINVNPNYHDESGYSHWSSTEIGPDAAGYLMLDCG